MAIMARHCTTVNQTDWVKDGDLDAQVIRIPNTGAATTNYPLSHQLGRDPVGVLLQKKNKAVDCWVVNSDANKITLQFSAANADVTLRLW